MSNNNSRPGTPLRRFSGSASADAGGGTVEKISPMDTVLSSKFIDLNDGFAQFEANLQRLQHVHESITSFNESFASFLYGIQMNAWCVEFPEAPSGDSFARYQQRLEQLAREKAAREQQEREEQERRRQLEIQRQRELEIEREKLILQQEEQQQHHDQQRFRQQQLHSRGHVNPPATVKKSLKRPTDYTPGRPTYGKPPAAKFKSANGESRIPTRPSWK